MTRTQLEKQLEKKLRKNKALDSEREQLLDKGTIKSVTDWLYEKMDIKEEAAKEMKERLFRSAAISYLNLVGEVVPSLSQYLDLLRIIGKDTSIDEFEEKHRDEGSRYYLIIPDYDMLVSILLDAYEIDETENEERVTVKRIINYLKEHKLIKTDISPSKLTSELNTAAFDVLTRTYEYIESLYYNIPSFDIDLENRTRKIPLHIRKNHINIFLHEAMSFNKIYDALSSDETITKPHSSVKNGLVDTTSAKRNLSLEMYSKAKKSLQSTSRPMTISFAEKDIKFRLFTYLHMLYETPSTELLNKPILFEAALAAYVFDSGKNDFADTRLFYYLALTILRKSLGLGIVNGLLFETKLCTPDVVNSDELFFRICENQFCSHQMQNGIEKEKKIRDACSDLELLRHLADFNSENVISRHTAFSAMPDLLSDTSFYPEDALDEDGNPKNDGTLDICVLTQTFSAAYHRATSPSYNTAVLEDLKHLSALAEKQAEILKIDEQMQQMTEKQAALEAKLKAVESEKEQVAKRARSLDKDNRTMEYELKKIAEENEVLKKQLAEMRDIIEKPARDPNTQYEDIDDVEEGEIVLDDNTETIDEDIQFPYTLGKKVLFCGGHTALTNHLTSMFPDIRIFDGNVQRPTRAMIKDVDIAFLSTHNSHKSYYRLKYALQDAGIPYYHINTNGRKKTAQVIVSKVRELEAD